MILKAHNDTNNGNINHCLFAAHHHVQSAASVFTSVAVFVHRGSSAVNTIGSITACKCTNSFKRYCGDAHTLPLTPGDNNQIVPLYNRVVSKFSQIVLFLDFPQRKPSQESPKSQPQALQYHCSFGNNGSTVVQCP